MKNQSVTTDAFAEIMKVTNHIGLWDADLAWYPPNVTHLIYLNSLKNGLRIHGFMTLSPCLIVKILATRAKLL